MTPRNLVVPRATALSTGQADARSGQAPCPGRQTFWWTMAISTCSEATDCSSEPTRPISKSNFPSCRDRTARMARMCSRIRFSTFSVMAEGSCIQRDIVCDVQSITARMTAPRPWGGTLTVSVWTGDNGTNWLLRPSVIEPSGAQAASAPALIPQRPVPEANGVDGDQGVGGDMGPYRIGQPAAVIEGDGVGQAGGAGGDPAPVQGTEQ